MRHAWSNLGAADAAPAQPPANASPAVAVRTVYPRASFPRRVALLLFALAGFLALFTGPAAPAARAGQFSDVPESGPTSDAVGYLVGAGVISGYPDGTFRPDMPLNRGQATKILVLQHGLSVGGRRQQSDVQRRG